MRKTESEASLYGNGETWVRGPLLGKGGFGSVFLANSKKPKSRFHCFPSTMAVKSAEFSLSASLQKEKEVHNNVQGSPFVIHCFGEEITTQQNGENMVYNLLLEYASGGTLSDLIKNSGGSGLPESDVKRYTKSMLKGLSHVHDCGYVHCDLKPENVLLVSSTSENFVAKIGDLGLAKRSGQRKKGRLDYLRGTALYMAPETVIENVQDMKSDIWAFGCVVCEMLTGKSPWDKEEELDTEELLNLIGDERELPKIPSGISREARDFLKACLVRKPMFRFTVEMLMDHPFLADVDEAEPPAVVPSPTWTEANFQLSGSSFSDDDDLIACSCSEDDEDFGVGLVVISDDEASVVGQKRKRVALDDDYKFRAAAQANLKFPASFVPVGA